MSGTKTDSAIGIRWDVVREELDAEEWIEREQGIQERLTFLGTVFALYPSGKYYTPWACSNVDACQACQEASEGPCDETSPCNDSTGEPLTGEGHCEVCQDAAFSKALEDEASAHGFFVTSSEGDPCDILLGESRDTPEDEEEQEGA
jgi:hypothetical protein